MNIYIAILRWLIINIGLGSTTIVLVLHTFLQWPGIVDESYKTVISGPHKYSLASETRAYPGVAIKINSLIFTFYLNTLYTLCNITIKLTEFCKAKTDHNSLFTSFYCLQSHPYKWMLSAMVESTILPYVYSTALVLRHCHIVSWDGNSRYKNIANFHLTWIK